MNAIWIILLIAILGGGAYFAYRGVQETLADDKGRSRRDRRKTRNR